jgi:DNA-3-methyladenine glycosylase II
MASVVQFELSVEGPLDLTPSLEVFRRSGDDLLDRWDGEWLIRTVRLDTGPTAYAARVAGTVEAPALTVMVDDAAQAEAIKNAIAQAIPGIPPEWENVGRLDPVIGRLAQIHRGFRPMLHPDLMVALIRCISAQQVNLRWAATTRRRLAEKYGRRHLVGNQFVHSIEPRALARADVSAIRALQFTTRKAEYIVNAARAIADGELSIEGLRAMADDEVIARVTAVRGLGLWTAEWVLARTLGRARISARDLGVRKAVGKAYFDGRMPSPEEALEATAHWGGAGAFAQELLLHAQHEKTLVSKAHD